MIGVVVGIDNGVSGALAYALPGQAMSLLPVPVKVEQNYQKKAKNVTRIDHAALTDALQFIQDQARLVTPPAPVSVVMEKPFVNPGNFVATSSSLRAFEATLVVLEQLGLGFQFLDAPAWQKKMLPVGTRTRAEQKAKSREIGLRQFPHLVGQIKKIGDADAVWIAEYARLYL